MRGTKTLQPPQPNKGNGFGINQTMRDGVLDPNHADDLVGAIIAQAMNDGMTAVELAADRESDTVTLRYFGPADSDAPQWWDMTGPPLDVFPLILKTIFRLATLAPGLPIRGSFTATTPGGPQEISIEMNSVEVVVLRW